MQPPPPPEIECEQDYEQCLAEGYGAKCAAILEQCMQPPPPPDCPAYEQCLAQGYGKKECLLACDILPQ